MIQLVPFLALGAGLVIGGRWLLGKLKSGNPSLYIPASTNAMGATVNGKLQNPPANPNHFPPFDKWVKLEIDGKEYLVSPIYLAPIGIGEAVRIARELGLTLPTPKMVDAIWKAADLKIGAVTQSHNGTKAEMNSVALTQKQRTDINTAIAERPFKLLGGGYKDIVFIPEAFGKAVNKPGIYGMHKSNGKVVQEPMWGHAMNETNPDLDWKDYSQGLRGIKEV